jgi:hypothetical protein
MANTQQFIYDALLTNYGIKAGVGTFDSGVKIAPLSRANSINGSYLERSRQLIGEADLTRAPGEDYKFKQAAKGELKALNIKDHGIIVPVPLELVEGYEDADLFAELQNATIEAGTEVQYSHAVAVKNAVWADSQAGFNAKYGASNVVVPSTKWNANGSTIEQDIAAAIERVRINSGYRANVVAMPQTVFNAIADNANSSVYERLKFTSSNVTTQQKLAELFRVQEVIVFGELTNTANPGQAAAYGDLFTGDNVLVFYRDDRPIRDKMNLASTFFFESARVPFLGVTRGFNTRNNSHEVKSSAYFDVKLTAPSAGNVLWDVLS